MRTAAILTLLIALAAPAAAPFSAQAAPKCLGAGDKVSGQVKLVKTGAESYAAVLVTRRPVCALATVAGGAQQELRGQTLLLAFDGDAPRLPLNRNSRVTIRGTYAPPIASFPGDMAVLHTIIVRVDESDAPPPAPPKFPMAKPGGFDSAN